MKAAWTLCLVAAALVGVSDPAHSARKPKKAPPSIFHGKAPVPVILDSDIGPDVDDAGATAILNAMADRGEARILAMCCCTSSEWGAPCLNAINTYYGRRD